MLAMAGASLTGEEAKELGIVSETADSVEDLEDKARSVSRQIMRNSPQAVYSIKRLMILSRTHALLEASTRELVRLAATEEAIRAARVFYERRGEPRYEW
jgi:enoyl-CoA hydratase/carnithine racemase